MAYCFECGEKIAENDIFCPYCGITIQPIAVAGAEDDNSFGATIAVSPVSAVNSELMPPSSPFAKSAESSFKEEFATGESKNQIDDFSNDVTSENVDVRTQLAENLNLFNEIQPSKISEPSEPIAPVLLKERLAERFSGEFSKENNVETTSDFDLSAVKPADDLPISESPISELPVEFDAVSNQDAASNSTGNYTVVSEIAAASTSQTESSLMSYEEAEVKEILSAEEPEKSVDDAADAAEENAVEDSIVVRDSNTGDLDVKKNSAVGSFDGETDLTEKTNQTENSEAAAPNEEPTAAELPISIPNIQLPADNCPPSRFDSVSIMEKTVEPEESAPAVSTAEPPKVAEVAEEFKDARSFTTPISANSDTGGKNKAKLKPLDEGTVLNGRYEVIRKIGGGGMGAVYLASDKNLGGVLRAVKEMVQSYIEDEQQQKAVSDFKRESLLLTSLEHQSIPTIYDYFFDETEARFYLVMKYISGGDLAGRLRSAPESRIDEREVTNWAIQIADVLDYLHNRQPPIVYRDLKPANIMVDGNSGRVMLIDFGIARWVNKEEKGVTAVGTMGYAPPELFSGNVEARSDIYSLGSTMFHLLTGADPQSNPLLIFDFQKHPRPRQINPQLSDQMERILMRAVEYNADKRFASAAELKKALEEHQENLKTGKASYGVKEAPVSIALSDQPVFCGFCGQKIVATDMFCAFCGSKQPLAQHGVHSHTEGYTSAPLTAQLLIIGTSDLEQPAFRLEKEDNLVGRRDPMSNIFPEVDLSKFDPQTKISRRHARIWREGNEFMLEDLGSSNGTYILPVVSDTMRLQPRQPQMLTNGDKIRLGDTTLHFILG